MTKKERIEYLETQVAGLHDKLSETIGELEAVKKQLANNYVFPTINIPAYTLPQIQSNQCAACKMGGVCSCVRPGPFTFTSTSGVI